MRCLAGKQSNGGSVGAWFNAGTWNLPRWWHPERCCFGPAEHLRSATHLTCARSDCCWCRRVAPLPWPEGCSDRHALPWHCTPCPNPSLVSGSCNKYCASLLQGSGGSLLPSWPACATWRPRSPGRPWLSAQPSPPLRGCWGRPGRPTTQLPTRPWMPGCPPVTHRSAAGNPSRDTNMKKCSHGVSCSCDPHCAPSLMSFCKCLPNRLRRESRVHRCVQGLEWGSLQWGAWSSIGMAASNAALLARLKRQVGSSMHHTCRQHLHDIAVRMRLVTLPVKPVM